MANSGPLTFAYLIDWMEGRLSAEEAQAVAEQVALAGEAVRADVAWLRAFLDASAGTVLAAPPAQVHALLARRFEAYARSRRGPGLLQRVVATLTFDSQLHPSAAGVRGASTQGLERQLVYSTDIANIVLNIQPRLYDRNLDVSGQVFPKEDAAPGSFTVQLLRDEDEIASVGTDDLGEFVLEAVPPAAYDLTLHAEQAGLLIVLVELHI
jgi:hypothetical protein